jgi:hypothetical protein
MRPHPSRRDEPQGREERASACRSGCAAHPWQDEAISDAILSSLWGIGEASVRMSLSKLAKRSLLSRDAACGTSKLHDLQRLWLVRTTETEAATWHADLLRACDEVEIDEPRWTHQGGRAKVDEQKYWTP